MPTIHEVLDATNKLGIKANLAGGPVRDFALGIESDDIDMSSPMHPDEMAEILRAAGRKVNTVNKSLGTLLFKVPVDGTYVPVEMTTYRTEVYERGSRRPSVVFVNDLHSDLARRDFTINAMAIKPNHKLVDPFGGRDDLAAGIIRAVGRPRARFEEDVIRILRAYRFVAKLGFDIEEATRRHMVKALHRIVEQPKERWMKELDKLLVLPHAGKALRMMFEDGAFMFILPELHVQFGYDQRSPYHDFPLHEHTVRVVESTPADVKMRWAALLHDVGKPTSMTRKASGQQNYIHHAVVGAELVKGIAHRMRWSNEVRDFVHASVRDHLEPDSWLKEHDSGAQKLG